MKHRRHKGVRGAAVVEAAILLPLLVLLTLGFIEVGRYVERAHFLHNAARQGARTAVRMENSNAEVEAAVLNALSTLNLPPDAVTVRISKLTSTGQEEYQVLSLDENEAGDPVRVTVTLNYAQMGPFSNLLKLAARNISNSAVMQREE